MLTFTQQHMSAITILIQDLEWHVQSESVPCDEEHKDIYLQLWKDLLQFLKENKKGDAQ